MQRTITATLLALTVLTIVSCRTIERGIRHDIDRHIEKVAVETVETIVEDKLVSMVKNYWPHVSAGILGLLATRYGIKFNSAKRNRDKS